MYTYEEELLNEIAKLKETIENLETRIIDYQFELNYNKQTELLEFVRELYSDIKKEISQKIKSPSKKLLLNNLKFYIEYFAKYNKITL